MTQLAMAGSGTTPADIVAGVVIVVVIVLEAIYVLRQTRGDEDDGEGGALVPADPRP
jgi:hypothetical protein